MKIIISPAKKMRVDNDSFLSKTLPEFLSETELILTALREKTFAQLQKLWKCNDEITKLNTERLAHMNLHQNLTPALFAYDGIQYQYMAPDVFDYSQLDYIEEHLRILSGFYGILRPFDGVTPYRLEMAAKLEVEGKKDLYKFWGEKLANMLSGEDFIVNLASKEYSSAVTKYLKESVPVIDIVFGEKKDGKIIEKGTMCKMARGQMVRFMAEHQVKTVEELKGFDSLDYRYSEEDSEKKRIVFLKQ